MVTSWPYGASKGVFISSPGKAVIDMFDISSNAFMMSLERVS